DRWRCQHSIRLHSLGWRSQVRRARSILPLFFLQYYGTHRDLHSFPTRRSSDLRPIDRCGSPASRCGPASPWPCPPRTDPRMRRRSEEHTSELQSQSNLVCRLLLEKKKADPLLSALHAIANLVTPRRPLTHTSTS